MKEIEQVRKELYKWIDRSAWNKGVKKYALELLDNVDDSAQYGKQLNTISEWKKALLNGAENCEEYSYGGSAFIYDEDIAKRLCTPSEFKRKRGGELNPNSRETWLDVQARALNQAYLLIKYILIHNLKIPY